MRCVLRQLIGDRAGAWRRAPAGGHARRPAAAAARAPRPPAPRPTAGARSRDVLLDRRVRVGHLVSRTAGALGDGERRGRRQCSAAQAAEQRAASPRRRRVSVLDSYVQGTS